LGKDALACFVIVPTAALKVWKATGSGWGSSSRSTSVEVSNTLFFLSLDTICVWKHFLCVHW
jgi:hypothetical protein